MKNILKLLAATWQLSELNKLLEKLNLELCIVLCICISTSRQKSKKHRRQAPITTVVDMMMMMTEHLAVTATQTVCVHCQCFWLGIFM